MKTSEILGDIYLERREQEKKWGVQNHDTDRWVTILLEEVGEVARAVNDHDRTGMIHELLQSAAVCVAFIENVVNGDTGHGE